MTAVNANLHEWAAGWARVRLPLSVAKQKNYPSEGTSPFVVPSFLGARTVRQGAARVGGESLTRLAVHAPD